MKDGPFPGYFDVSVEGVEGSEVVRLQGELDLASAPQLEELLVGLAGSSVVVDLSGLGFIDSSGFGALVRAQRRLQGDGRLLTFRGPLNPEVARTFRMLGMPQIAGLDDSGGVPEET